MPVKGLLVPTLLKPLNNIIFYNIIKILYSTVVLFYIYYTFCYNIYNFFINIIILYLLCHCCYNIIFYVIVVIILPFYNIIFGMSSLL